MTAQDYIQKWRYSINHLGRRTIGINVVWDIIPLDSKVTTFLGKEAWDLLYRCVPPWFKSPQTFKFLSDTKNSDYMQIVREETENNKIKYYRSNGMQDSNFCVFANQDGSFMLLGDGNHRLFDCIHLIHSEGKNFDEDISKTSIEVIYLPNFLHVLRPDLIWQSNWKQN